MASSPSLSNNGLSSVVTPPKTLRGLNKPKCIQCGNVARSRFCFYALFSSRDLDLRMVLGFLI